jgi:hypothetical protein
MATLPDTRMATLPRTLLATLPETLPATLPGTPMAILPHNQQVTLSGNQIVTLLHIQLAAFQLHPDSSCTTTYAHNHHKQSLTGAVHTLSAFRKRIKLTERVQLTSIPCCSAFTAYKIQQGINAKVYTATTTSGQYPSTPTASNIDFDQSSTVFSPLLAYTAIDMAAQTTVQESTSTYDNKQDILTQSQMLKAPDVEHFIASQIPEFENLKKSKVMEVHSITTLPATGKLLSSIWSYQRKRSPQGALLKHKAWICADG